MDVFSLRGLVTVIASTTNYPDL